MTLKNNDIAEEIGGKIKIQTTYNSRKSLNPGGTNTTLMPKEKESSMKIMDQISPNLTTLQDLPPITIKEIFSDHEFIHANTSQYDATESNEDREIQRINNTEMAKIHDQLKLLRKQKMDSLIGNNYSP